MGLGVLHASASQQKQRPSPTLLPWEQTREPDLLGHASSRACECLTCGMRFLGAGSDAVSAAGNFVGGDDGGGSDLKAARTQSLLQRFRPIQRAEQRSRSDLEEDARHG